MRRDEGEGGVVVLAIVSDCLRGGEEGGSHADAKGG